MKLSGVLIAAFAALTSAQNNCTMDTKDYPFFLYAYNYGKPVFTNPITFFPISAGSSTYGIAVNYNNPSGSGNLYPTTWNITEKSNLLSKTNDVGSKPYLNAPIAQNAPLNFNPYNATTEKYGLFGLQSYANTVIGSGACRITINRQVVPWYLCMGSEGTDGHLYVTYKAAADRYCIVIDLVAYSEG